MENWPNFGDWFLSFKRSIINEVVKIFPLISWTGALFQGHSPTIVSLVYASHKYHNVWFADNSQPYFVYQCLSILFKTVSKQFSKQLDPVWVDDKFFRSLRGQDYKTYFAERQINRKTYWEWVCFCSWSRQGWCCGRLTRYLVHAFYSDDSKRQNRFVIFSVRWDEQEVDPF